MLAGVCAGLALKWNMNVTLVRIAAVAASMVYGIGLIAYIVDWIRFPERPTEAKRDHQQERLAELWRQARIRDQQRIAESSSDPLSFLRTRHCRITQTAVRDRSLGRAWYARDIPALGSFPHHWFYFG